MQIIGGVGQPSCWNDTNSGAASARPMCVFSINRRTTTITERRMLQYAHDRIRSVIGTTVFLFTDSFFGLLQNAKSSTRRPCDRAQQCPEAWSRIPVTIPNTQRHCRVGGRRRPIHRGCDRTCCDGPNACLCDSCFGCNVFVRQKMSSHCCASVFCCLVSCDPCPTLQAFVVAKRRTSTAKSVLPTPQELRKWFLQQ